MKNKLLILLLTSIALTVISTSVFADDFDSCVQDYKVFADRELNTNPKPKGTLRAQVAMNGFKAIQKSYPNLSFDELVQCASQGTKLSNDSANKPKSFQAV